MVIVTNVVTESMEVSCNLGL